MYSMGGPCALCIVDPATGVPQVTLPPSFVQSSAIAHDGAFLYSIQSHASGNRVNYFNPADGRGWSSAYSGTNWWNNFAIDYDQVTDTIWVVHLTDLYKMDRLTGAMVFQGAITGIATGDAIFSMAIDAAGNAVAMGNWYPGGVTVYRLDLASRHALLVSSIVRPFGLFVDLAFRGNGELWCVYNTGAANIPGCGVFTFDVTTSALTLKYSQFFNYRWLGIAFGPGTAFTTYCTGKANSLGCTPSIYADGIASATGTPRLHVTGSFVINRSAGTLWYGVAGRSASPFAGGTLCVAPPLSRVPTLLSGGSATPISDCSGVWTVDVNTFLHNGTPLPAGTTIACQWMGRDSGFAPPFNRQLSNAVEFTLRP